MYGSVIKIWGNLTEISFQFNANLSRYPSEKRYRIEVNYNWRLKCFKIFNVLVEEDESLQI